MPTSACPPDDRLRAFDSGDVADAELDAIADHLGRCPACVAKLATVAVPMGDFGPETASVPDDSAYRHAVERIAAYPTLHPPLPNGGDTLRDYHLVAKVGQGGMGTVFRAVHTKLDKVVAVKVLSGRQWNDPSAVARFEREMKAVGRLAHPNIVQATDADDADGVPFLVMEFVDGENLSALVKRAGPRPLAEAVGLLRQAAAGLDHAHLAGVIHRDVKPSNLMLARDGTVKVLDLGLALPLAGPELADTRAGGSTSSGGSAGSSDLTSASHTVGTLDYMAPEQKKDAHAVDARADVYGLGCTLWYLLTGSPPRAGDATDPTALPGGLPAGFWKRFLASDPADRFPSVSEAVEALDRVVTPPRKRRGVRRLAAVGAVPIVGAVIALFAFTRPPLATTPNTTSATSPVSSGTPDPPPPTGELGQTTDEAAELQKLWADHLRRPVTVENSVGQSLVLIPPGKYASGVGVIHIATKPYAIARTEVTRGQFRAFLKDTAGRTQAERVGDSLWAEHVARKTTTPGAFTVTQVAHVVETTPKKGLTWEAPGYEVTDDDPAVHVTWAEAGAFCEWLSAKEKKAYRLPSQAEWQWAARAGDRKLYIGARPKLVGHEDTVGHAWSALNSTRPSPVAGKKPNPWGLYDTVGNVGEWCRDTTYPPKTGEFTDTVHDAKVVPTTRAVAGGGYADQWVPYSRVELVREDTTRSDIGFRVVCEVP